MKIPWLCSVVVFATGVNVFAFPGLVGTSVADMSKRKIIMKMNFLQSDIDNTPKYSKVIIPYPSVAK